MATGETSHAAPASAKATAAGVGAFFFLVIAAAIVYAIVAGQRFDGSRDILATVHKRR